MTSGTLGLCIHIADSWVRSRKNIKSLFWNKDVSEMSMMTSNMFCVVEQRLKQSTGVTNTSLFQNKLLIFVGDLTLEEIVSKSTLLVTRSSRLAPKKCINKSIWLATGGHLPWVHHGYLPGANQIDLFMHFPTHESRWPRLKWTSFLLVYKTCDCLLPKQCPN